MHTHTHTHTQIPAILEHPATREFLSVDDQRSALPIYDQETIDEPQDGGTGEGKGLEPENRMDLGPTEKVSAMITDFDLLKVIGKGSFGKVRPTLALASY